MPDFKYNDEEIAGMYSGTSDYPQKVKAAVKEMYRQVGDLELDERGVAVRGLLVRHLVLPEGLAGTEEIMEFLAREISPRCYVNVMKQYFPYHKAHKYPPLDRRITREEYRRALEAARAAGLERINE